MGPKQKAETGGSKGTTPEISRAIAQLRQLLRDSHQLEDIWHAFNATLATRDAFYGLGEPAEHAVLQEIVATLVPKILPRSGRLLRVDLTLIEPEGFWHGPVLFEGAICTVLFNDSDELGFLTMSDLPPNPSVNFVRFSLAGVSRENFPIRPAAGTV